MSVTYKVDHLRVRCGVLNQPQDSNFTLTVNTRDIDVFKVTEEDIKYLDRIMDVAYYSENNMKVTDTTVRNSKYTKTFDTNIDIEFIMKEMGVEGYIKPYKMNLYTKGSFFSAHRDTARRGLMGTLVLILPTTYTGGEFVFSTFSVEDTLPKDKLRFIYFDAELEHSVNKVLSGNRITLVYNVFDEKIHSNIVRPNIELNSVPTELYDTLLREAIEFCKDKHNILFGACKYRNDIFFKLKSALEHHFTIIEVSLDKSAINQNISSITEVYELEESDNDIDVYSTGSYEEGFESYINETHKVQHVLFPAYSKLQEKCEIVKTPYYGRRGNSPECEGIRLKDYTVEFIRCYLVNPINETETAKRARYSE